MGFWGALTVMETIRTELTELAWNAQRAGEAISVYDVVFRDGDFWKVANARVVTQARPPLGMAQDAASSGGTADIWIRGIVSNGAWSLTSGSRAFLASGGGVTATAPAASGDTIYDLGMAVGIRAMEFNPGTPVRLGQ